MDLRTDCGSSKIRPRFFGVATVEFRFCLNRSHYSSFLTLGIKFFCGPKNTHTGVWLKIEIQQLFFASDAKKPPRQTRQAKPLSADKNGPIIYLVYASMRRSYWRIFP